MTTQRVKKDSGSGWRKVTSPDELEKCIVTMLNKILRSDDPLIHSGRFASLANVWLNARRLSLESGEWKDTKQRLELIEQATSFNNQHQADNFKKTMQELKELSEEIKIETES